MANKDFRDQNRNDSDVSAETAEHSERVSENLVELEEVEDSDAGDLSAEYTREAEDIDQKAMASIPTDWAARVRAGMVVLLITFVGFGGWAFFAPLDGAAIADGRVIVESQNRSVQHLEGGIVEAIYVQDGDRVEQGQALLELSDTRARTDLSIVESELLEVLGQEARLLAERTGAAKIDFPEAKMAELADDDGSANVMRGQIELFEARKEGLEGRMKIFEQRIGAYKEQISGLRSMNANIESRIESYTEELQDWQALFEQELADRTRINEMQRELFRLQGELDGSRAQVAELTIKVGEVQTEMLVARQDHAEQVSSQLRETQRNKADLLARRAALVDALDRTTLYAPASGTIVASKVHTVGGIISPGDVLMEVVPMDQAYVIKAKVNPQDIDRVVVGQLADLQLAAFNFQAAHVIEGEVIGISADTLTNEKSGESFYEARVRLTEAGMDKMQNQGMFLVSGMPATVMIKTGERTLFEYLVSPVTRMFSRAFREE